jgi:hypothetical protein
MKSCLCPTRQWEQLPVMLVGAASGNSRERESLWLQLSRGAAIYHVPVIHPCTDLQRGLVRSTEHNRLLYHCLFLFFLILFPLNAGTELSNYG